ncbi:MAG: hypothetical protein A2186_04405 [Candidatus Levybacteria bacterium RIFOXYA1_FULL_41_10]|uniref:2'-5' RNA ligase n=1 Tax=Candidatus Curtissbacteria bacterium RIFCSPHIGHO2_12_41_11 TaxID=1797718 RepID=A0A1F5H5P8_9BACT|nr:MAG: hypothetical protein UT44_C0027G0010 [Candidatus Levybacteria bacterium GW2011_GWA1_39_32]KKR50767.1 MAG: hypothetical protein UT87_C0012G0012 [Candidatus Levybacteria bacterium GW2011_GWC1_40_19]KKR72998.1 MAG: hypothetical protein UU15_C0022G0022 [Candidatus Levybacteria bacterium GW2011_GWC2_40_7]KKR93897.1 MAG: hypothetical protein UU45_C0021G0019 [Candidatus Levybacteria bacterium GW2011_GWA2_41_15]KKS00973.1 MAG: hypothetical protein UU52_C0021G0009 [Candidatus Levybacteria bacter
MDSAISINIAILPPKDVRDKAVDLSRKLAQQISTEFALEDGKFYPHITIYQATYPKKNFEKILRRVSDFAKHLSKFEVKQEKVRANNGFVSWDSQKDPYLFDLQKRIIAWANPLREDLIPPFLKNLDWGLKKDKDDVRNFGSMFIGPRYRPHITITRAKTPEDSLIAEEMLENTPELNFLANKIIIGNVGDHGTVNEILEEFNLS